MNPQESDKEFSVTFYLVNTNTEIPVQMPARHGFYSGKEIEKDKHKDLIKGDKPKRGYYWKCKIKRRSYSLINFKPEDLNKN